MSPKTIRDIWNRRTWTHATGDLRMQPKPADSAPAPLTTRNGGAGACSAAPAAGAGREAQADGDDPALLASSGCSTRPPGRPKGSKDKRPRKRKDLASARGVGCGRDVALGWDHCGGGPGEYPVDVELSRAGSAAAASALADKASIDHHLRPPAARASDEAGTVWQHRWPHGQADPAHRLPGPPPAGLGRTSAGGLDHEDTRHGFQVPSPRFPCAAASAFAGAASPAAMGPDPAGCGAAAERSAGASFERVEGRTVGGRSVASGAGAFCRPEGGGGGRAGGERRGGGGGGGAGGCGSWDRCAPRWRFGGDSPDADAGPWRSVSATSSPSGPGSASHSDLPGGAVSGPALHMRPVPASAAAKRLPPSAVVGDGAPFAWERDSGGGGGPAQLQAAAVVAGQRARWGESSAMDCAPAPQAPAAPCEAGSVGCPEWQGWAVPIGGQQPWGRQQPWVGGAQGRDPVPPGGSWRGAVVANEEWVDPFAAEWREDW